MNKLKKEILDYDEILVPSIEMYRSLTDVYDIILRERILNSNELTAASHMFSKLLYRSKVLCNKHLNQVWYPIDFYNDNLHVYVEYIKLRNVDKDWIYENGPNTLFHLKYDLDLIRHTHYFMKLGDPDRNGVIKLNIHLSAKYTTRHQLKSLLNCLDKKRCLILYNEVYNVISYENKSNLLFNETHLIIDLAKIQED